MNMCYLPLYISFMSNIKRVSGCMALPVVLDGLNHVLSVDPDAITRKAKAKKACITTLFDFMMENEQITD